MQHQWIPAKVGDVIKKVESHYYSKVTDGDHFVVLDVLNGDNTAIVLDKNGKLVSLCYPEEYEVVGRAQDLVDKKNSDARKRSLEGDKRIAEEIANGTYVDPFEMMVNFREKYGKKNRVNSKPPKENRPKGDIYKNDRRVD